MKKTQATMKKELQVTSLFYILAIILSHLPLLLLNNSFYHVDFLIPLFACILVLEKHVLTLFKIFLFGLLTDLLLGSTLGVYALSFLLIFTVYYFFIQFIAFKTNLQKLGLLIFITFFGVFVESLTNIEELNNLAINHLIINSLLSSLAGGFYFLIMSLKRS